MASISEVGHGKNVANLEDLTSLCVGFGVTYNPSNVNLKVPALNALKASGDGVMLSVKSAYSALKNATNERELAFEPLKTLSSRVLGALKSSGASKLSIKDGQTLNNKIQGRSKKKTGDETETETAEKAIAVPGDNAVPDENVVKKEHSTSQQSFDSRMEHLTDLVTLVAAIPAYNPNEVDLKITGLNATAANLKAKNTAVINAFTVYTNALAARNKVLYGEGTGLVDIAKAVKDYVKSVYTAGSPQFKAVNKISFRTLN